MSEPQDPYQGQPYQNQPYPGGYPGYPGYPSADPADPAYSGYPGYPNQPVPYGYPQQPGYAPYGYPYGYPGFTAPTARRPGTTTASAVLAFVTAGLLILAALILFTGASTLNDLNNDEPFVSSSDLSSELDIDAVVNLVAGGLLLIGGIQLVGRKHGGRQLICVGSVITAICSIYWLVRPSDVTPAVFWALLFAALVVITTGLAFTSATRDWLAAKTPT